MWRSVASARRRSARALSASCSASAPQSGAGGGVSPPRGMNNGGREPRGPNGEEDAHRSAIPWTRTVISGVELLRSPKYNKGMAFTEQERDRLYLRGLLPPFQMPQELQIARVMTNVRSLSTNLERYSHLVALQERNERLFYAVLTAYPDELKPIIYAPTVGQACVKYGLLFRRPRGLFISMADRGRVYSLLKNWPEKDVKLLCLTDGERVLGLGDLGIQGMGIAASKVVCYTAFGGIDPSAALPVTIDAGTDNEMLLNDPFYIGLRHKRVRGEPYDELIDEFIVAAKRRWGSTVLFQFEDFGNENGRRLLDTYRGETCAFNDDIQGTAAAMLGGILAAMPLLKGSLGDQTFLFAGAGETGTGMADLLACAISKATRQPLTEARKRIWLFDSKGLVTRERAENLEDHKLPWAHPGPAGCVDLLSAVNALKPSCLIGVRRHTLSYDHKSALSGTDTAGAGLFTKEVLSTMAAINERPLVFALSRPVGNSECTAADAYAATEGRVIYASGCLQPPVTLPDGRVMRPLNSTSCYIFPGVGLGAILSGARNLRDDAFLAAAEALAARVTDADRAAGSVYPSFDAIRDHSAHVARAVAAATYDANLATRTPRPRDLLAEARAWMYDSRYKVYGNA